MTARPKRRGAYRKSDCVFVGAWVPQHLARGLDQAVEQLDSDRSKLLREAIIEKLGRVEAARAN